MAHTCTLQGIGCSSRLRCEMSTGRLYQDTESHLSEAEEQADPPSCFHSFVHLGRYGMPAGTTWACDSDCFVGGKARTTRGLAGTLTALELKRMVEVQIIIHIKQVSSQYT